VNRLLTLREVEAELVENAGFQDETAFTFAVSADVAS